MCDCFFSGFKGSCCCRTVMPITSLPISRASSPKNRGPDAQRLTHSAVTGLRRRYLNEGELAEAFGCAADNVSIDSSAATAATTRGSRLAMTEGSKADACKTAAVGITRKIEACTTVHCRADA